MKNTFKKLLSAFLVVLMLLSVAPVSGMADFDWGSLFATKAAAATYGYYTYSVSDSKAEITGVDKSINGDIEIPSTLGGYPVTSIGLSAFYGCSGLTSITIPDSVTSIGNWAFQYCSGLTSITIPDSVTSIGDGVFRGCTGLTSIVIPDSVTSIGEFAFSGCTGLTSITIGNSVTNIGDGAFSYCTGLTTITIPNSVTSIGDATFFGCTGLTSITIPNSVTSIGWGTFYECESLSDVFYTGSEEDWNKINIDNTGVITEEGNTEEENGNEALLNATIHFNYVPDISNDFVLTDENTGIKIEYSTELDNNTEILVDEIFDGESLQLISTAYGDVKTKLFNISLQKDGDKVQPSGEVTVKIPLPADFNPNKVFVTYVDSNNGKATKINCEVKDGYVLFKTNHFSEYAIVEQLGGVESVSLGNVTMDYKSSKTLTPEIVAAEGTDYTVTYSSDSKNVTVDENGKIYAAKRGSANITVTVTDSDSNTVTDTCKVTVEYTWWQWIIKIVLFGWIWY